MRLRRHREAARPRRRIRKLRLLTVVVLLTALAGVAFTFGLVRAVESEIPSLDPARQRATDVDSVLTASDGYSVLAVLRGDESRVLLESIDEVAPIMRQSIVSVEDQRFYEHRGVDVRGIGRALWEDVRAKKVVEGGSTITQQFVKNTYIRNERTVARKVREAALAWQLEQQWPKDRILLAYLNTIYFGNGAYGIQQAARTYFGKGAKALELHEAALLAGLPADPSAYDPARRPRAALARRSYVLALMVEQGKISPAQARAAAKTPLPRPDEIRLPGTQGRAPYFVNYVKDQLVAEFGAQRVFGGGLRVRTTIDLDLQQLAREAIEKVLPDEDGPAAALVAIEPRTGAVRVMFGGSSFRKSQFNLAAQAERQPGSAFKPIVLATAMRQGIAPESRFQSKPVEIDAGDRVWKVTNYEGTYLGWVDLDRAMVTSDNAVYAQLTRLVRPAKIVETAGALGISSELEPYFSIGLGALAVNPLDMARAYATVANDGKRVDGSILGDRPRVVERIERVRGGRVRENAPVPRPVLTETEARRITSILEQVVRKGTGVRAAIPGRAVAGKTGTTDDYADAWFVGYTPELVTAVWVGYPSELRPMLTEFDGEPVAGGTLPALIWKEFTRKALAHLRAEPSTFAPPEPLPTVTKRILWRDGGYRLDNGICPGTRVVTYFAGRGPDRVAQCRTDEVRVPKVVGLSVEYAESVLAAKPLGARLIFKPAVVRERPGKVVSQDPRSGFLAAGQTVTLVVTKARHGLVPNVVGSSLEEARERLRALRMQPRITWSSGRPGTVLEQRPLPGVAAEPGLPVTLVVARGTRTSSP